LAQSQAASVRSGKESVYKGVRTDEPPYADDPNTVFPRQPTVPVSGKKPQPSAVPTPRVPPAPPPSGPILPTPSPPASFEPARRMPTGPEASSLVPAEPPAFERPPCDADGPILTPLN
jgi:hypothetical protein